MRASAILKMPMQLPAFTIRRLIFFALKDSTPYIIEAKTSLKNFISPGETQKRRLKEVMDRVENLNIAILQIRLGPGEFRIFYNDDTNLFF